ncbi:hypothetical protein [Natrinema salifodinae]|uniref:hypothetical protein n=1 Tax=Natrinema salifodinae TaxID=1202768 RepID=UPI001364E296|nr:hypothetical protein [Natrinema salifodinae]
MDMVVTLTVALTAIAAVLTIVGVASGSVLGLAIVAAAVVIAAQLALIVRRR